MTRSPSSLKQRILAAPVVAAPLFPDRPAQPARRAQDLVACFGSTTVHFPGLGVLAGRDDGIGDAQGDRFVAILRIVSAIATSSSDIPCSRTSLTASARNSFVYLRFSALLMMTPFGRFTKQECPKISGYLSTASYLQRTTAVT